MGGWVGGSPSHPYSLTVDCCCASLGLVPMYHTGSLKAPHTCYCCPLFTAAAQLWHQRHKWAARRTAHLLAELPDAPPLAGVVSAWEAINIQIGAMVEGAHFGSIATGGGAQLWASLGVRSRQQERGAALEVAAGHVAAAPVVRPVEDEPLSSSAASSTASDSAEQQAGLEQQQEEEAWEAEGVHPPPQQQQPAAEWQSVAAGVCSSSGSGRGGPVRDSPSEMPSSPQLGQTALRLEQQQPAGGSERDVLGGPAEAALQEAAAAAVAADFMHPSQWAAARQAAAGGGAGAHSSSSCSITDGSGSVHSFLLPGVRWSSSEASSAASDFEERAALAAAPAEDAEAVPLPLYGRGDHLVEAARQLSMRERVELAVRAGQLLVLFTPFLLLGSAMLLLASQLERRQGSQQQQQLLLATSDPEGAAAAVALAGQQGDVAASVPAASRLRTAAFELLLGACRRAGAGASWEGGCWCMLAVAAANYVCL